MVAHGSAVGGMHAMVLLMMVMVLLVVMVVLLLVWLMRVFVPHSLHVPLMSTAVQHTILELVWVVHPKWIRGVLHGRSRGRGSLVVRRPPVVRRRCVARVVSMMSLLLVVKRLLLMSGPSTVMPVGTICHLLGQTAVEGIVFSPSSPSVCEYLRIVLSSRAREMGALQFFL